MKTVRDILPLIEEYLTERDIKNARRNSEEILSSVLKLSRVQLYMEFDRPINKDELDLCRNFLVRRSRGEPIQYIYGKVDFLDCEIHLTRDVFIPRQETEILTDMIINELSLLDCRNKYLWDMCCGSGCIGIAIKKKFPELNVILSDISPEALQVAQKNAVYNNVEASLHQGDLFKACPELRVDFFVCNPPYVTEGEYIYLESEVRNYEPKKALVAGNDGLEYYRRLSKDLHNYLNDCGKAWFEIGENQRKLIYEIFDSSLWKRLEVKKDWSGKDRFFFVELERLIL